MALGRRGALLLALGSAGGLAACGGEPARQAFPPLRYEFLTPLQLNVASIQYAPLPPPNPLDAGAPAPAGPALRQMAEDRLVAAGSSGEAVVTIEAARIARTADGLDGVFALRVDVLTAEGGRAGFAEARVTRRDAGIGRDVRAAAYEMTKQMLDDMNVELEFQLRQSLRDYLQSTTVAPAPAAVEQQDL